MSICRDKDMPRRDTINKWLANDGHPDIDYIRASYVSAKDLGLELGFDEIEEIARAALSTDSAVEVQARRLLIDAQKWRLSKLAPKKYGDKLAIGGDSENPVKIDATHTLSDATQQALAALANAASSTQSGDEVSSED